MGPPHRERALGSHQSSSGSHESLRLLDGWIDEIDFLVRREPEYGLKPLRPKQLGGLIKQVLIAGVQRVGVRRRETGPPLCIEAKHVGTQCEQIRQQLWVLAR